MGAYELDKNTLETVGNVDNEAVFVAGNAEDDAIIARKIELDPNIVLTSDGPVQSAPLTVTYQVFKGVSAWSWTSQKFFNVDFATIAA